MNALDAPRRVRAAWRKAGGVRAALVYLAWLTMVVAAFRAPPNTPRYLLAWLLIGGFFLGMKVLVLARMSVAALEGLGPARFLGFLLLWPGMQLDPFLPHSRIQPVFEKTWFVSGLLNMALGAALLWAANTWLLAAPYYARAAAGLAGAGFVVLFGAFQLLAVFWRRRGVPVQKQWRFLPGSESLSDYWNDRWNRAFHDFAVDAVYRPLKKLVGRNGALLGTFLFSGVVHDIIVSVPAQGGYGLPTLYFLLQGIGIFAERQFLPAGWPRRVLGTIVLLAPFPLLFHRSFLINAVLPQLDALRGG